MAINMWYNKLFTELEKNKNAEQSTKSKDKNLWLRRTAIDFQQRYKEKTNQKWVKDFIGKYEKQLHKLSVKEAVKYL